MTYENTIRLSDLYNLFNTHFFVCPFHVRIFETILYSEQFNCVCPLHFFRRLFRSQPKIPLQIRHIVDLTIQIFCASSALCRRSPPPKLDKLAAPWESDPAPRQSRNGADEAMPKEATVDNTTKTVWTEVDVDTLPEQMRKALTTYRERQKAANEAREAFNSAFIAAARKSKKIPDTMDVLVSHNFGKLSVAVTKAGEKRSKGAAKPLFTF